MIGYETLPETLPPARGGGGGDAPAGLLAARLRSVLIGLGLSEVMTHSLAAPSAFDDPRTEFRRVAIRQALSAELSGLRQALVPNLLDVDLLGVTSASGRRTSACSRPARSSVWGMNKVSTWRRATSPPC